VFDPDRMAGRILQQGDVVGLVEKAQQAFDEDQAKKLERKVAKEGKFDLEDFLMVMGQMQKMGPLESLLKMIPGVNHKLLKQAKVDPKRIRHVEAIILSMTPQERRRPDILNGSRPAADREGVRPHGAGGEPSARAVQADAEADEAVEGDGHGGCRAGWAGCPSWMCRGGRSIEACRRACNTKNQCP
jgi:hypothetical protein